MRSYIAALMIVLAFGSVRADSLKEAKPAAGKPSAADEKAMMEVRAKLAADNELKGMVGTWAYHTKSWVDPSAPPQESDGTEVITALMGGRYIQSNTTGTMEMPGPDGKPVSRPFVGMGIRGYDNLRNQFIALWMDNMGIGIIMSEGTYDAATKTFTYTSEYTCGMIDAKTPGTKIPVREVVRIVNPDSHVFEWYETRGGHEMRTMEITYTRK